MKDIPLPDNKLFVPLSAEACAAFDRTSDRLTRALALLRKMQGEAKLSLRGTDNVFLTLSLTELDEIDALLLEE